MLTSQIPKAGGHAQGAISSHDYLETCIHCAPYSVLVVINLPSCSIYPCLLQSAQALASCIRAPRNIQICWSTAQCSILKGGIVLVDWYGTDMFMVLVFLCSHEDPSKHMIICIYVIVYRLQCKLENVNLYNAVCSFEFLIDTLFWTEFNRLGLHTCVWLVCSNATCQVSILKTSIELTIITLSPVTR